MSVLALFGPWLSLTKPSFVIALGLNKKEGGGFCNRGEGEAVDSWGPQWSRGLYERVEVFARLTTSWVHLLQWRKLCIYLWWWLQIWTAKGKLSIHRSVFLLTLTYREKEVFVRLIYGCNRLGGDPKGDPGLTGEDVSPSLSNVFNQHVPNVIVHFKLKLVFSQGKTRLLAIWFAFQLYLPLSILYSWIVFTSDKKKDKYSWRVVSVSGVLITSCPRYTSTDQLSL